jgi:hypothetical protein
MAKALPLHHPTIEELHKAHAVYVEKEPVEYVYRVARHMLASEEFTPGEAVHLLMRTWNAQSPYTWKLKSVDITGLLEATAAERQKFVNRSVATLAYDERETIAGIYTAFRKLLGGVGAAKALALLHPRFFPIWDRKIAIAHLGHKWSTQLAPAEHYLTFMDYAVEQCTAAVSEAEFGETLLKTLDEWNYGIWTKHWITKPAAL